ncbi:MAG: TIGR03663 family protein, partial [Burkholderiales bacterium]|nr:TIGR03663 family protein [Anaerolineae bacterium]
MATIVQPKNRDTQSNPLNRLLANVYTLNWEVIAYLIIFVLAVFTRFHMLGDRVMSHDESLHTRYSYNLFADGDFQHTPLMHGPILFHITALMYFLFGDNDFTARIYPAVLGILITLSPIIFKRWLGQKGALLTSVLLLVSPLLMYYNRYIREDTPSLFSVVVMVYCIFVYLSGPENQRRRARWLYIFAAALLHNLGTKETAFFYVAIFGSFLTLFWLARLAQHYRNAPGKTIFFFTTIGILIGAVAALGMYVILSIVPPETAEAAGIGSLELSVFVNWTLVWIVAVLAMIIGPLLWSFRRVMNRIKWIDVILVILIALVACAGLIVIEELSREVPNPEATAEQVAPGDEAVAATTTISMLPIAAEWVVGVIIVLLVLASWRIGLWNELNRFPEFDFLILMGTLVLPWLTAIILVMTGASPTDYSQEGITRALLAFTPLMAISVTVGLVWNWKRWLISATIFYALFTFFFTTMFTNMPGLATGMVGSLGYWLEQQGVRRGSQPQYYYLLVIMPFYEFLPIIGSVLGTFAGMAIFWKRRQEKLTSPVSEPSYENFEYAADAPDEGVYDDVADSMGEPQQGNWYYESEATGAEEVPSVEEMLSLNEGYEESYQEDNYGQEADADVHFYNPTMPMSAEGDEAFDKPKGDSNPADWLSAPPFLPFVGWWAILTLIALTLAGEKMPWLAVHMTLPMIFLTGWYFGRVFAGIDMSRFRDRGWLFAILLPLLYVALVQVIGPFLVGQAPFRGLQQEQLAQTGRWFAVVAVSGLVMLAIYQLVERTGWRHLRQMIGVTVFAALTLLSFRSAWMASFINYDLATEFLVYAHAGPAIKWVLDDLEEISRRTTGGLNVRFAYDDESSWPYSWYFRHFTNQVYFARNPNVQTLDDTIAVVVGEANRSRVEPLLEDRYERFEYVRLWWPMQDYFNLTPQRVVNALDFSSANPQAAQIRQGMFDIWWARDYTAYGEAIGSNFELTQWPVADRMHFYVRRDIAAQIWSLGVGEGEVVSNMPQEVNVCNANWQPLAAPVVFGSMGAAPSQLNHPLGLAVSQDGRLFVAEEFNHRLSVFDTNGVFQTTIGQEGAELGQFFTRPNGVAFGPDGNLYVADTWNYRISVFSPEGEYLFSWGQAGTFGANAPVEPMDAFWGPRDVEVDAEGRVYVSDTGNKRIRVYSSTGEYIRDIGSAGSEAGQVDEPVGLAVDSANNRLYVADTWNRRIQVFSLDGEYQFDFRLRAWYDELGNRP